MKYLLDTNTCVLYLNGRVPILRERIHNTPAQEIVVCSVVRAELYYGAVKSQTPDESFARQQKFLRPYASLPFDDFCLMPYARLRAGLEQQGTPIGSNDMLIAAIALAYDLILVTHNTREFSRIEDLMLEDWQI